MKVYAGQRLEEGCEVYVLEDGKSYPLPLHTEIWNHSPTGFEWGYGGSGPAQLALAILADFLGPAEPPTLCPYCGGQMGGWECCDPDCAYDGSRDGDKWAHVVKLHQEFKSGIIASLANRWTMDGEAVRVWVSEATRSRSVT